MSRAWPGEAREGGGQWGGRPRGRGTNKTVVALRCCVGFTKPPEDRKCLMVEIV